MRWSQVLLSACLPIAIATGCSGARAEDPHSVLRSYAQALEEGRAEDAYRMLSEEARRGVSLEAFRRMVKDNPEDVREIARALGRSTSTPVVTASVTTANGQELELVLENGKWKVEATAIDLYAQDTPRHTAQGFLRALERKRYDVLLKYVPDKRREGLDAGKLKAAFEGPDKENAERVIAGLRQALATAAIEETGDHASLPYGQDHTLTLVRERGLWKIDNF